MDLRRTEYEGVDWIELIYDGIQRKGFIYIVTNVQVPKIGLFLGRLNNCQLLEICPTP